MNIENEKNVLHYHENNISKSHYLINYNSLSAKDSNNVLHVLSQLRNERKTIVTLYLSPSLVEKARDLLKQVNANISFSMLVNIFLHDFVSFFEKKEVVKEKEEGSRRLNVLFAVNPPSACCSTFALGGHIQYASSISVSA